jgi:aspartyl-tRNA synthetase
MAFVEQEDILQMFEQLIKQIFKDVKQIDYTDLVERISWEEAMWTFGNDKPDIRFNMKLANYKFPLHTFPEKKDILNNSLLSSGATGFQVFDQAETIIGFAASGCSEYTRKQIDELTEWVKRPQIGMQGMVYIKCNLDGTFKSSVDKFFGEESLQKIAAATGAQAGDLVLLLAGKEEKTRKAASELRLEMGKRLGLRNPEVFAPLWVTDFPLLEWDEDSKRWHAMHHPFTSPKPEDLLLIDTDPGAIRANAYDMVINGVEVGGGSIRIHDRKLQARMFELLGFSDEDAKAQFGFLMNAFEFGAPPHGGIAFGFDRLCSLFGGSETIRDYIAFPKNNMGRDVMIDAPSAISLEQKKELGL